MHYFSPITQQAHQYKSRKLKIHLFFRKDNSFKRRFSPRNVQITVKYSKQPRKYA